ncbi:hypothetical protein LWI28_020493 [Acer negundo]|uniref:Uncharacterized protein n=1 Tax=Acer negundo TaxID=4023 RepID=A0AAD5IG60_ACENE|nr:hypothetical protein LWI28_020493 [Acer negundo]
MGESVKKETGFDFDEANVKVSELVGRVKGELKKGESELTRFRTELVPAFVEWNRWELWKDVKNWEPKRIGTFILFKKSVWRKKAPKGLKLKKFIEGPDGTLIHDSSYVGEDAWVDDPEPPKDSVKQVIDKNIRLSAEENKKLTEDLGISDKVQENNGNWRERLGAWKEIMRRENLSEGLDSSNAKYVVEFDMKEVENSLRKDVVGKVSETQGTRALWIAKRWWRYRPKLPYTYFLDKLDSSEVAAVVFTEDLKRLYVTMKEGFPLEYVVDVPLDPHLFEIISSSGVEVDLLQKRQIHYFLKVVIALLPGILILWLIRESVMLLHITSSRFFTKSIINCLIWLMQKISSWVSFSLDLLEQEKHFCKDTCKRKWAALCFASGAEFTDSEKSGVARINEMFSIARRNAPAFIFVDEIDAIAGRQAIKDPRRRATFEALIAQLDGEPDELDLEFVRTGRIDRRLYIGLPDAKQRVQIFGVHSAGKQLAEDVNFEEVVFRTVGFSGADIRNLVNEAAIMSVSEERTFQDYQQDIVDVLDKQLLEARALNSIFQQWGISANQEQWNISGELCSGDAIATDTSDFDSTSGPNPYIKCVCTYSNNTHCEKVYALNVIGVILDELWTLTFLTNLSLGQNYLTGPLSASIGNLTRMQYFTVGINALSGELPKELGNMTDMRSLRFQGNSFDGPILNPFPN